MGLKLPFPKFLANTLIKVSNTDINEDGEPVETTLYEGKCIYTDKSKSILDAEKRLITLTGKVVIEGDINPGKIIKGYVKIGENKKIIYSVERPLNPDGTVFSTELSLQ